MAAAASEPLLGENQCVVHFTVCSLWKKKEETREVFDCGRGKTVGDVHRYASRRYAFENYKIARISDERTKQRLPPTHLLEKGVVYAVEVVEKTVTIQLKVDDGEPKRVAVPCSLLAHDLPSCQHLLGQIYRLHPVDGYLPLDSDSNERVQGGATYWIKTDTYDCIKCGDWVSARVGRLASKLFGGEKQKNVEAQAADENPNTPTGAVCCCLVFLVVFCSVVFFALLGVSVFFAIQPPPTANGDVRREVLTTTQKTTNNDGGDQLQLVAKLAETSASFDLERTENKTERGNSKAERAALLATIGELQKRVQQLDELDGAKRVQQLVDSMDELKHQNARLQQRLDEMERREKPAARLSPFAPSLSSPAAATTRTSEENALSAFFNTWPGRILVILFFIFFFCLAAAVENQEKEDLIKKINSRR